METNSKIDALLDMNKLFIESNKELKKQLRKRMNSYLIKLMKSKDLKITLIKIPQIHPSLHLLMVQKNYPIL